MPMNEKPTGRSPALLSMIVDLYFILSLSPCGFGSTFNVFIFSVESERIEFFSSPSGGRVLSAFRPENDRVKL